MEKSSISSGASSGCYYTCFIYNLPSCDYFIREEKQKILEHVSHGKFFFFFKRASLMAQIRMCLQGGRPGFDPWEGKEGMATHSSIFAWRIPQTEETNRL